MFELYRSQRFCGRLFSWVLVVTLPPVTWAGQPAGPYRTNRPLHEAPEATTLEDAAAEVVVALPSAGWDVAKRPVSFRPLPAGEHPAIERALRAIGSPSGSTYSIHHQLGADVDSDGLVECFDVGLGVRGNIVTFDGNVELLDALQPGGVPYALETELVTSTGVSDLVIVTNDANAIGLFSAGLSDPNTGTPLTDACYLIGLDDPLAWSPAPLVVEGHLQLFTIGGQVVIEGDVTSFFSAPWDGTFGVIAPNSAGLDIAETRLTMTVVTTDERACCHPNGFCLGDLEESACVSSNGMFHPHATCGALSPLPQAACQPPGCSFSNGDVLDGGVVPASQHAPDIGWAAAAADDFALPSSETGACEVTQITAYIAYFNVDSFHQPDPAADFLGVNVTIYADDGGAPAGKPLNDGSHIATAAGGILFSELFPIFWSSASGDTPCMDANDTVAGPAQFRIDIFPDPGQLILPGGRKLWLEVQPVMERIGTAQVAVMLSEESYGEYAQQVFPHAGLHDWRVIDGNTGSCDGFSPGTRKDLAFEIIGQPAACDAPTAPDCNSNGKADYCDVKHGSFIYWIDLVQDNIKRANTDGSNVEVVLTGLSQAEDLAIDPEGGKMYWADPGTDTIHRANLDGSGVESLVTAAQGLMTPEGLALDLASGKMYWTDVATDKVQRANTDGSNVEDLLTSVDGVGAIRFIALDPVGGKMYFTDSNLDRIQRANLDGSNFETLLTAADGLSSPADIEVDTASGKIYWTDRGTDKILRANLDGSNIEELVTTGLFAVSYLELDLGRGKIYWGDSNSGEQKISRANLDGTDVEDLITTGLTNPRGIALTGGSADCDGNGVPDECDPDCDSNGVPDTCDIAAGASADCNSNGVPDECEVVSLTIVNQLYEGDNGGAAQDFGDADAEELSVKLWDDFTTSEAIGLTSGQAFFTPTDWGGFATIDFLVEIADGPGGAEAGGTVVLSTVGIGRTDDTGIVEFDFGGAALPQGTWWVSVQALGGRPAFGQVFWGRTNVNDPNGSEHYFHNPGGGFGHGPDPVPGSVAFAAGPADLAFTLNAISNDCNGNGVPDACDIAAGAADCDLDGVIDSCQADCDSNGTPDTCELGQMVLAETFDTYAEGSSMHGQGGWTGWDNDPALGAIVTDEHSRSLPYSVDIWANADLVQEFTGATTGRWKLTAWQYIPPWYSGSSSFLLLNTYNDGGPYNWSTQLTFDYTSGQIESFPEGAIGAFVTGVWAPIRVEIDLDLDTQSVFYNNVKLLTKSWTEGASGGGAAQIAALDLFANGASSIYYDNVLLTEVVNDCNSNGLPDDCELDGGDCDGNGVLDVCELTGNDCNTNQILDGCELSENDCNTNGVPDDCDLTISCPVFDNGVADLVQGVRPGLGWTEAGVADDFDLLAGESIIAKIRVDMLGFFGSGNLETMRVRIFSNPAGLLNLGSFAEAVPVYDQTFSVANGNLSISDTGLDLQNFDLLRLEATGPVVDLGPGSFALHLGFPGSPDGYWATSGADASDCAIIWGSASAVDLPVEACGGFDYTQMSFTLEGPCTNDCNDNLVPDDCDIAHGTSADCDSNGVPDECDIASGLYADCNLNGILDECELVANDCNTNDIPDDCDVLPGGGTGRFIYSFGMDASQQVPPNESPGAGSCTVILEESSGEVTVNCTYEALTSTVTVVFIHGLAPPGTNAGVIMSLTPSGGISGTITGSGVLTPTQVQGMLDGLTYVNLRTASFPGGEIRGQILGSGSFSEDCNSNGIPDECDLAGTSVPSGFALEFDGVNNHVLVPSHPALRPPNDFTIEVWVNPQQIGTTQNLVQHDEDGGGDDGYTLNILSDGRVRFTASNANGLANQSALSDQTLTAGQWYHLAGVYDNSVVKVYVDGQETSHVASGDVVYTVFDNVNIGRRGGTNSPNTNFFHGQMDEVRFWNVPRSQAEVVATMDQPLSGGEPGLVSYWRFDEGSGSTAFDSANMHDGTLVNGPLWAELELGDPSGDCNSNNIPDECEPDLDGDTIPDACDPCAGGQASGDSDGDGHVTLIDFHGLSECLLGPLEGLAPGCECFDFDAGDSVDLLDAAEFQLGFAGD